MKKPFSVSSTLTIPSLPRYFTNSVRVTHFVEFMWMWFLSWMYSWYTWFARIRFVLYLRRKWLNRLLSAYE